MSDTRPVGPLSWLSRRVLTVAAVVLLLVGVTSVAAISSAHRVDGDSMAPTLRDGDRVLANPLGGDPGRFDLVTVSLDGSARSVKRVIGLPGDEIEITVRAGDEVDDVSVRVRPAGTDVWHRVGPSPLDGRWGQPAQACCRADGTAGHAGTGAQTVPVDHYFVLGDNPARSADARTVGWISEDRISSVIRWRVWPPSRLGRPPSGFVLIPDP